MTTVHRRSDRGFSLVELMVAMGIMLVVSGGAFTLLSAYQRAYTSNVLRADLHAGLRTATQILAQEIGQAGLLSYPGTTTTAAVPAGAGVTVTLTSTSGLFVGEKLVFDVGTAQENITLTAVGTGTITATFTKPHAAGTLVSAAGVFPQGVLSSSTATQLRLLGDVNADGTLVYVKYDCNTAGGTFSRSSTPITAAAASASVVLVDNVIANPGGTACFTYTTTTTGGYTFVTTVGVTLSAQTASRDPQTQQFVQETKLFLNLAPRNVLAGLALANAGLTQRLQPTPPGVPLP
jgi:prepilin-type N-terminal cleavage/methylation domain-containing protein